MGVNGTGKTNRTEGSGMTHGRRCVGSTGVPAADMDPAVHFSSSVVISPPSILQLQDSGTELSLLSRHQAASQIRHDHQHHAQ